MNMHDQILSHHKWVHKLANRYRWFNVPKEDLIQAGYLGLCKAAERYDASLGIQFNTYATKWIQSEMADLALRHKSIVKIATTKPQRKLLFNSKVLMTDHALKAIEIDDIATQFSIRPTDVKEMEMRLKGHVVSYDNIPFIARLGYDDPEFTMISNDMTLKLRANISTLPERHAVIVYERWLKYPVTTLKELANRYNISIERVRQLDVDARRMLMEMMQDDN